MVNPRVAFERRKAWLSSHNVKSETDLQFIVYTLAFDRSAEPTGGDPGGPFQQAFPANATLVLGIQGSCIPDGQPDNPFVLANDRYRVLFQYNANQMGLVVAATGTIAGGIASSVFGQFGDAFPARELALEANDVISGNVQNLTPEHIRGTLSFHCLVWKYAQ